MTPAAPTAGKGRKTERASEARPAVRKGDWLGGKGKESSCCGNGKGLTAFLPLPSALPPVGGKHQACHSRSQPGQRDADRGGAAAVITMQGPLQKPKVRPGIGQDGKVCEAGFRAIQ